MRFIQNFDPTAIDYPSGSTLTQERWNLVSRWISNCSSHTICHARRNPSGYWPSRLVYIPHGPLPQNPRYRLVDTKTSEPHGWGDSYVTLSHCWGPDSHPPYRTTIGNLEQRLSIGIAESELPPLFKDAIHTAWLLRIPYLWLDSLCIVQDDEDDWTRESAHMKETYINSILNLSATAALSSRDRMYSPLNFHPRILMAWWSGDLQPGIYLIMDLKYWVDRVANATINTRGWVLQERLLAPCILHFSFDSLLWECCEFVASEAYPDGLPDPLLNRYTEFKQKVWRQDPALEMDTLPREQCLALPKRKVFHDWHSIINMYSRCELTFPDRDKLVCTAGLTEMVQQQLNGDEYLAGLWRSNLLGDLLWQVDRGHRHVNDLIADGMYVKRWDWSRRSKRFRAPSWSWASVDGIILPGEQLSLPGSTNISNDECEVSVVPCALVHSAEITLRNTNFPLGQVSAGRIIIQGRLYRLWRKVSSSRFLSGRLVLPYTEMYLAYSPVDVKSIAGQDELYFLPLVQKNVNWRGSFETHPLIKHRLKEILRTDPATPDATTLTVSDAMSSAQDETSSDMNPALASMMAVISATDDGYAATNMAGIIICPTEDRKYFYRIGALRLPKKELHKVHEAAGVSSLTTNLAESGVNTISKPDMIYSNGNITDGVFEII